MKKTIAILLILVIGMVGVFAEGEGGVDTTTTGAKATIDLKTKVVAYAAFGVTKSDTVLANTDFANYETFMDSVYANVVYNNRPDGTMSDFVGEDSPVVGYLHGISNQLSDVNLHLYVDPFTTTDDEDASIALTVTPTTATIAYVAGTRGYLANEPIKVFAKKTDVDLAPASDNYETTIRIVVTAE